MTTPAGKPAILHKGTAIRNIRLFIDQHVGAGAYDRFCREVEPSWSGTVLRTVWYDMYTCTHAYAQAAKAMGISQREIIKQASKFCLEQDLGTVARAVLTVFDPVPKTILALWPKMATGYINFGRIEIVENVPGRFSFDFFAIPDPSPEFVASVEGSMEGVLRGLVEACKHKPLGYQVVQSGPDPADPKMAMFRCLLTYEGS
ncbi:MAG: hypothetical protein QM765_39565 [Myxococcales bacterium]